MTGSEAILIFADILFLWIWLNIISLFLICFRKDRELYYLEIKRGASRNFPFWLINIFLIFLILPLTIPYSISHLIKWRK